MLPAYWGKTGWIFLFAVALDYPINPTNQDKEKYKTFFLLLQYILPCQDCSNHFSNNLLINPLDDVVLSTRMNLINWLIKMKNIVNKQTGKEEIPINKALQIVLNRQNNNNNNIFYWLEPGWTFLHAITIEYPVKPIELDKEKYKLFFNNLADTMPDVNYRNYYKQALQKFSLNDEILSSQTNLVNWGNEVHNFLNEKYGINPISSKTRIMKILLDHDKIVDEQKKIIVNEKNEKRMNCNNLLFMIFIIVLLIVISIIGCCFIID